MTVLWKKQKSVRLEDLTERDIAEVLGCAVGTVKSQLSRALSTLRGQGAAHLLVSKEAR